MYPVQHVHIIPQFLLPSSLIGVVGVLSGRIWSGLFGEVRNCNGPSYPCICCWCCRPALVVVIVVAAEVVVIAAAVVIIIPDAGRG